MLGLERRPRGRAGAGPAVYTVARGLPAAHKTPPCWSSPGTAANSIATPTRGEYKACLPCRDLNPAAARPLRPARVRQVSAQGAILGAEQLKGWGPVTRFFCPGQLSGVSLADDVSKPWLRNVPSLAGAPAAAARASVSASVRWAASPRPARRAGCPVALLLSPARLLGAGLPCPPGRCTGPERGTVSLGLRLPSSGVH